MQQFAVAHRKVSYLNTIKLFINIFTSHFSKASFQLHLLRSKILSVCSWWITLIRFFFSWTEQEGSLLPVLLVNNTSSHWHKQQLRNSLCKAQPCVTLDHLTEFFFFSLIRKWNYEVLASLSPLVVFFSLNMIMNNNRSFIIACIAELLLNTWLHHTKPPHIPVTTPVPY